MIHRFVRERVANAADASDIAQQALLQACAALPHFQGPSITAWLRAIAGNLVVDYYRTRQRRQLVPIDPASITVSETALRLGPNEGIAVCPCGDGLVGWLDCMSHRLSLAEQVAILLADVHGCLDRESAVRLEMSLPSFKLLLHGARQRLRYVSGDGCTLVQQRGPTGLAAVTPRSSFAHITPRLDESRLLALQQTLVRTAME